MKCEGRLYLAERETPLGVAPSPMIVVGVYYYVLNASHAIYSRDGRRRVRDIGKKAGENNPKSLGVEMIRAFVQFVKQQEGVTRAAGKKCQKKSIRVVRSEERSCRGGMQEESWADRNVNHKVVLRPEKSKATTAPSESQTAARQNGGGRTYHQES